MTRVVITGMGCVTPLGNTVETTWQSLIAGQSGVGVLASVDTSQVATRIGGEIKGFDAEAIFGVKEARRSDRITHLALAATDQAMTQAGLQITAENAFETAVLISSGFGGVRTMYNATQIFHEHGWRKVPPMSFPASLPNIVAASVAMHYGIKGVNFSISAACATSAISIGEGAALIQRGDAEIVLVGGTESPFIPWALAGLNAMRAMSLRNDDPTRASRPFDGERDGFVPAEGAAVLILESYEHAVTRSATILAELVGYHATCDAWHVSAPDSDGAAITHAMRKALSKAHLTPEQIDYISAHGTSTVLNDVQETRVIKAVFGDHAYQIPISAIKSMTGHAMSAAGALEAISCVLALRDGILPPTINQTTPDPACDLDYVPNVARRKPITHVMSNSFGFGGQNAVLLFKSAAGVADS